MSDWQLAIVPTDTVYGIVCKLNSDAINRVYEIKGRDKDKPLILFGKSREDLKKYSIDWFNKVDSLAHHYWPGPLTIILPRSPKLPDFVNPNMQTIGMRVPDSKSVIKLLDESPDSVLLSTSANLSGEEPIVNYDDAVAKFADKVDLIVKPEPGEHLSESASTVVEFKEDDMTVLRQGEVFVGL